MTLSSLALLLELTCFGMSRQMLILGGAAGLSVNSAALVTGVLTTTAATVFNGGFAANAASTITTADNTAQLTLISTDADASSGPQMTLYRNSSSPADNDFIGRVKMIGRNDNSQDFVGVDMIGRIIDASDGTEDSEFRLATIRNGTESTDFKITPTEVVFNEDGADLDFRVESATTANALFVEGSSGNVGIGASPSSLLHIKGANPEYRIEDNNETGSGNIVFRDSARETAKISVSSGASASMQFQTLGTEAMRIDSSQRVLIGTDSSIQVEGYYRPKFQVAQAGSSDSAARGILINYGRNDTGGGAAVMYSRHSGTTVGSEGNVLVNYTLGENKYTGWYSDNYYLAANIKVEVDGTPSSADMPGRIVFATTADGASSATERMRIDSYGNVIINNGGAGNEKTLSITGTGTGTNPAATSYSGAALMLQNNYATDNAFSIIDFNNSNSLVTSRIAGVNSNISSRLGDIALLTHNGTGLTEAMRITSSQWVNLGVGTDAVSSPQTGFWNGGATGYSGILNIQNVNSSAAGNYVTIAASKVSNDSESAQLGFGKSRGTTANSRTIVADGDSTGILTFQAADGTDLVESVRIVAAVDGTPGADDMPGRLQFFTTADGASSPTERMRLDQAGNLTVGTGNYPHTDKGIAYGDGTQRYGAAIYKVQDGIASGEGLSITLRDDTGGWAGILTVMAHADGGANNYRHKIFAVMGRNTACTFTEIGGATGGTAPGITMSCPTAGRMKATFTIASGTVAAAMNFNGGWGF
jgi:hypothetical protein